MVNAFMMPGRRVLIWLVGDPIHGARPCLPKPAMCHIPVGAGWSRFLQTIDGQRQCHPIRVAYPDPAGATGSGVAWKHIDTRERTTLLCMVGAMARELKLDISHPMKAGEAIAAMAPELEWSARTIGEKLKLVQDAMDRRT